MKRMTTRPLVTGGGWALALVLCLGLAAPAAALHSVFVGVPGHSEEALTWCGPAVGEMVMEGYPAGACDETQADVWAEIVLHRAEGTWDTDPAGLRGAMMSMCPPPAGGWSIYSRADEGELMYWVAYWMTKNGFPVAAVMSTTAHNSHAPHQEHWVVIKGIVTDVDPTSSSSVTLDHVWITDPSPAAFGDPPVERFLSGAAWYADLEPVTKAGSAYLGEHVALIEPPERRGVARAELPILRGEVLPWERVTELSRRWLEKLEILRELKPFAELYRAEPLEPILVDPKVGGYYLVPFTLDGKTVRHAMLINAYDGSLLEVGAFAPVRYVGKEEAVERAVKVLRVRRPERVDARLTFAPEAGAASRYHPVWRVQIDDRTVAVREGGAVRFWPRKRDPIQ